MKINAIAFSARNMFYKIPKPARRYDDNGRERCEALSPEDAVAELHEPIRMAKPTRPSLPIYKAADAFHRLLWDNKKAFRQLGVELPKREDIIGEPANEMDEHGKQIIWVITPNPNLLEIGLIKHGLVKIGRQTSESEPYHSNLPLFTLDGAYRIIAAPRA